MSSEGHLLLVTSHALGVKRHPDLRETFEQDLVSIWAKILHQVFASWQEHYPHHHSVRDRQNDEVRSS